MILAPCQAIIRGQNGATEVVAGFACSFASFPDLQWTITPTDEGLWTLSEWTTGRRVAVTGATPEETYANAAAFLDAIGERELTALVASLQEVNVAMSVPPIARRVRIEDKAIQRDEWRDFLLAVKKLRVGQSFITDHINSSRRLAMSIAKVWLDGEFSLERDGEQFRVGRTA